MDLLTTDQHQANADRMFLTRAAKRFLSGVCVNRYQFQLLPDGRVALALGATGLVAFNDPESILEVADVRSVFSVEVSFCKSWLTPF